MRIENTAVCINVHARAVVLLLSEAEMDVAQTASFIQSMTYETGVLDYEEFPQTEEPVWVLGRKYSTLYDLDDLKNDIKSRLWFTYRAGFSAIGGNGPTQDKGWGCMLRCGQMILAQALILRHLGRDWRWVHGKYNPKYFEILRLFQDKKGSCYSIHQIASMGACEGKAVGQWFGPNTIAQVLRKLAVYDEWSSLAIHVAMDNTVIIDDLRTLCSCRPTRRRKTLDKEGKAKSTVNSMEGDTGPPGSEEEGAVGGAVGGHVGVSNGDSFNCSPSEMLTEDGGENGQAHCKWKPLLLIIPLRLGLTEVNPVYISSLKTCLTMSQSVGIIGGKPSHAHWFIGFLGDELIYLDPHTTQPYVDVSKPTVSDTSYHCQYPSRLDISQLDPSVALGFYCGSEAEMEDWCRTVSKYITHGQRTPMFEVYQRRPSHWPPFTPYEPSQTNITDYDVLGERHFDSDEEFELL